ncbi:transcriptional regulator, partial [Pseudomonas frederiksbergensis]|nr:transcriptional regulator [Pseudomonas frederiksbergensis]
APEDKDRLHVYGDVATQWTPGHWVGLRAHHSHDDGKLKNPGETVDALDKTRTGDLTWLGLEANSDAYNWRNQNRVNYWGSMTWLTGDRDRLNTTTVNGEQVASGKQSGDVNAWATDLGVRL